MQIQVTSVLPVRQLRATPMLKVLDGIEKALSDDIVSFALWGRKEISSAQDAQLEEIFSAK